MESKHGGRGRCVAVAWMLVSLSIGSSFGLFFDIDYILVVGHFGLATGSGGKTQSNMHNESCPK